jgi:predicted nuclease with TOPRIM domain
MTLRALIVTLRGRLFDRLLGGETLRQRLRVAEAEVDRLRTEVETLTDSNASKADRLDRLGETVVRLSAEVEALRADAERYRWLRDVSEPPHNFYLSVPDEFAGVCYQPGEVDAYIDAARAALGQEVKNG